MALYDPGTSRDSVWFTFRIILPFVLAGIGALAGIGLWEACDRALFGRITVGEDRLLIQTLRSRTEVVWSDLLLVEEIVYKGEETVTRSLHLVTEETSLTYREHLPHYDVVRAYALAKAPPDAAFVGFSPSTPTIKV